MRRLIGILCLCALGLAAAPAKAQRSGERPTSSVVTVLTDAVADPASRGALAVNELAQRMAAGGKYRVLPVSGQGAIANVRDLLYLRGVDFALLNNDVLHYLDIHREHADARRRIRYVTHLLDQKVYLLVRPAVDQIKALAGRKLAIPSANGAARVTAEVVFSTLRIDVGLRPLASDAALDDAALEAVDGLILLSDDLARLRLSSEAMRGLKLIEVPLTPALQAIYRKGQIGVGEIPGLPEQTKIDTIAVSTVLAVFDWTTSQSRYSDVVAFMNGFFAALPDLKRLGTPSAWAELDLNARLPGWSRHPAAQPGKSLTAAEMTALAPQERTATPQPAPRRVANSAVPQAAAAGLALTAATPAPATPPAGPPANVLVLKANARAPLADPRLANGGLIPAIVARSLAALDKGKHAGSKVALRWSTGPAGSPEEMLDDRSVDLSLPWESADCERPSDLIQISAALCDGALFSAPLLQVIIGYFTLADSTATPRQPPSMAGSSLCVPQDRDLSDLDQPSRRALAEKRLTVQRAPSLIECIGRVQRREADGFVANELEGRHLLARLGLGSAFRLADQPLATRGVHVIAARKHPGAEELIQSVNRGLEELKRSDGYNALVREHLLDGWAGVDIVPTK